MRNRFRNTYGKGEKKVHHLSVMSTCEMRNRYRNTYGKIKGKRKKMGITSAYCIHERCRINIEIHTARKKGGESGFAECRINMRDAK